MKSLHRLAMLFLFQVEVILKNEYIKTVMGEVEKMGKYFSEDILPMYMKKNNLQRHCTD